MTSISPLFAVEADSLFAEGRSDEALELCLIGIETFPEYAAAYVLASRVLSSLGRTSEAEVVIKRGLAQSRRNEALRRIADELGVNPYVSSSQDRVNVPVAEKVLFTEEKKKEAGTSQNGDVPQLDSNDAPYATLQVPLRRIGATRINYEQPLKWRASDLSLIPGLGFSFLRMEGKSLCTDFAVCNPKFLPFPEMRIRLGAGNSENDIDGINPEIIETISEKNCTPLEELAQRLERARIPVPREEAVSASADNAAVPEFVTDTMAAIYERQGALAQALKAYQILARNKPEKLPLYQAKINEITLKIRN
ncbi:hypothetical protein MASR2M18_19860 [Ignavibacteria bacterium]|nr:tetratricopeptide repeat protein [Bacteroidota bacterium]MCZ2131639.1 tetratricopeptide repeat protein [Bacteroidota bacterium]